MLRLPPLNDKLEENKNIKLPSIELLDIDDEKEKFKGHFNEFDNKENELISNEEVEARYKSLLEVIQNKDKSTLENLYVEELKLMGLYNLKKLEEAIDSGVLDLSKYNVVIMSKIINKLELIEPAEELASFNMKDMDDFYNFVSNGTLNLSKYSPEEIDSFIENLMA